MKISEQKRKWYKEQMRVLIIDRKMTKTDIAKRLDILPQTLNNIESGTRGLSDKFLDQLSETFGLSPIELFSQDTESVGHESTHRLAGPEQTSLPLIPVEAIAGFGVMQFQDLPIEGYYQVAEFSSADFLVRVKGDSMTPKYNAGDIIACKKVQDILFFQWGHIYVVDTKSQGMMVKRVRRGESDDRIELESENPNYDPFEIPLSDINSIALVMGAITLE